MFIDSYMDKILGEAVFFSYAKNVCKCIDIVNWLEETNPLKIPMADIYKYKFKKLLCSIALGMVPSKLWNGYDEANGGYIVVRTDGEVLAYHIYNRNVFEDYLLNNTTLERPSSKRHGYGFIYETSGEYYLKLNLQNKTISMPF